MKTIAPEAVSPALLAYLQGFLLDERKNRFEKVLGERTRYITCVMENIIDPHNANAVLRSCECFGVQDIHIIENETKFKPAKKVLKGAHKWLSITNYKGEVENSARCMALLKRKGYKIIATSPHGENTSLSDLDISSPIALVLGQENTGISEVVKQEADAFVSIPMQGFTESLNLSVAAAILIQHLSLRIRSQTDINWRLTDAEKNELRATWTLKNLYRNELLIERFYRDQQNT